MVRMGSADWCLAWGASALGSPSCPGPALEMTAKLKVGERAAFGPIFRTVPGSSTAAQCAAGDAFLTDIRRR